MTVWFSSVGEQIEYIGDCSLFIDIVDDDERII